MEGVRCSHPECRVHDFLPFFCPRCEQAYCLEHRSRFVHPCVCETERDSEETGTSLPPIQGSRAQQQSVYQAQMDRVARRHDETNARYDAHAPRTHFRIKRELRELPVRTDDFRGFYARLQALESAAHTHTQTQTHTSSAVEREREKQRRIAKKTRAILVKQRAMPLAVGGAHNGNNIAPPDRHYLVLHLDPQTLLNPQIDSVEKAFVYVHKNAILGDVLQAIAENPKLSRFLRVDEEFGGGGGGGGGALCAVVKTRDSPQWRHWNRDACVSVLCESCEDVFLTLAPLEEVRVAQQRVRAVCEEQRRVIAEMEREAAAQTQTPTQTQAPTHNEKEKSAVEEVLQKGETVWYFKPPPQDADTPRTPLSSVSQAVALGVALLQVKVEGVHYDDFPNVYYTVRMVRPCVWAGAESGRERLCFEDEKQTDRAHLLRMDSPTPTARVPHSASHSASARTTPAQQEAAVSTVNAEMRRLGELVNVRVTHGKRELPLSVSLRAPLSLLQTLLLAHTDVPPSRQKLLFRGRMLRGERATLQSLGVVDGAKISLMG